MYYELSLTTCKYGGLTSFIILFFLFDEFTKYDVNNNKYKSKHYFPVRLIFNTLGQYIYMLNK
jgi:hypothetical protein